MKSFFGIHQSIVIVILVFGVFSIAIGMNIIKSMHNKNEYKNQLSKESMNTSIGSNTNLFHQESDDNNI